MRPLLGHGSGFDSPGFRERARVSPLLGEAFHRRREAGLSLVDLYRQGRDHEELYLLAEALVEWDERVTLWRVRHFKVVERIIGAGAIGTQGRPSSCSASWSTRPLPELWDVRNELTELATRRSRPRGAEATAERDVGRGPSELHRDARPTCTSDRRAARCTARSAGSTSTGRTGPSRSRGRAGADVTGLDLADRHRDRAERAPSAGLEVDYVVGDARACRSRTRASTSSPRRVRGHVHA